MATWRVFEAMAQRDFQRRLRRALALTFVAGIVVGAGGFWLLTTLVK